MIMAPKPSSAVLESVLLREIREDHRQLQKLLQRLRQFALVPTSLATKGRQFTSLLYELRDQLAVHFSLEEACDYFESVEVEPRLHDQAQNLQSQHAVLYLEACELAEMAERLSSRGRFGKASRLLASRFEEFDRHLQQHESRENELMLQVLDDDIGTGD